MTPSGNHRGSPDTETLIFCFSYADAVQTFQSSSYIVTVKMASDKPLPFAYQFAAGAVAGVSEVGVNDKAGHSMQHTDHAYSRFW